MTRCIDCGGAIIEGEDHHCHTSPLWHHSAGLTDAQLNEQLDAFYTFVRVCGQSYLSDEGNLRFNYLRGEYVRRREERELAKGPRIPPGLGVSSALRPRM